MVNACAIGWVLWAVCSAAPPAGSAPAGPKPAREPPAAGPAAAKRAEDAGESPEPGFPPLKSLDRQRAGELLQEASRQVGSIRRRVEGLSDRVARLWKERPGADRPEPARDGAPAARRLLLPDRPGEPGAERGETARQAVPPLEGEDAAMHERLVRRQDALLAEWRALRGVRGDEVGERRQAVRDELRDVLSGILDLRERGRSRQLELLRRRLERLERELARRRDERVRRELVEARLRELLGEGEGEDGG